MKRICLLLCLLVVITMLSACSKGKGSSGKAAEKKPAPAINVISMGDQLVTLDSLKGKVVLLNFWATWCPPCREEIPSMIRLNKMMAGKPFAMVCVSVDEGGKKAVSDFLKNTGYSLPVYIDPTGQAPKVYGLTGVPETFIIDKNGIVAKKVVGPMDWSGAEAVAFIEGLMK